MRKKLIILFLFLLFPFFVSAYNKDDLLKIVESKKITDQQTENLYSKYFKIYARLLETKELDQNTINQIYENISRALAITEKYNINSIDDLSNAPIYEKLKLYDYLYDSYKLLKNAKDIDPIVKYNDDIEPFEKNENLTKKTFNYVGFNKCFVYLKYLLPISLLFIFIFLILSKKRRILYNICIIIFTLTLFGNAFYFLIFDYAYDLCNIIESMNHIESNEVKEISVKNKKIVTYPSNASSIGTLKIKDLDLSLPIYYGDSASILKKGLGSSEAFPGFGRTIISGHNSKLFLNKLKDINLNTLITIKTNYGIFTYEIIKTEVLNENEYSHLPNDNLLILYTCYPFDKQIYTNQRFIVYANLIKEEWLNA